MATTYESSHNKPLLLGYEYPIIHDYRELRGPRHI